MGIRVSEEIDVNWVDFGIALNRIILGSNWGTIRRDSEVWCLFESKFVVKLGLCC